jgi:hypothetical protein
VSQGQESLSSPTVRSLTDRGPENIVGRSKERQKPMVSAWRSADTFTQVQKTLRAQKVVGKSLRENRAVDETFEMKNDGARVVSVKTTLCRNHEEAAIVVCSQPCARMDGRRTTMVLFG